MFIYLGVIIAINTCMTTPVFVTSSTSVSVDNDSTATITLSDQIDLKVIPGTLKETFVRTETKYSTYQPAGPDGFEAGAPTVKGIVTTETYVLNYYPNIVVTPNTAPKLFDFIDNHWDLRQSATGPLDASRIHIFKNDHEGLPPDIYIDELGIPPFDIEGAVQTAFWFTKAVPGWRSGILLYDWHWLDPLWNVVASDLYSVPLRKGASESDHNAPNTSGTGITDSSSMFIPLRGCENLRMEIYEPLKVIDQPDEYAQSVSLSISGAGDRRETYKALVSHRASLIETINFDQAFSFDISANWVQFVNTGSSHAIWLEIIGGGVQSLMRYGTTFWVGNDQDDILDMNQGST